MKDPALLWYFNDWLGGTATLSRHLKGAYMDLLAVQFNSGPLSLNEIKTVLGSDFGSSWPTLQKKFNSENGLYFNERLEQEKNKRSNFTASRRKSSLSRFQDRTMDRMEDINKNRDINIIKNIYGEFKNVLLSAEEYSKLCEKLQETNANFLIEQLSGYIKSNGKDKYKDHYATLLNWARKKAVEHRERLQPKTRTIA